MEPGLYDHNIIDFDSDYLSEESAAFVRRAVEDQSLVADLDLSGLRRERRAHPAGSGYAGMGSMLYRGVSRLTSVHAGHAHAAAERTRPKRP